MENKRISLREWLKREAAGEWDSADVETQIAAGWYDWFCKDAALARRLAAMASKVRWIARSKKVDPDRTYVFFKNNCPLHGKLYDDFRICDLETRNVIYTVVPRSGFADKIGRSEVWGRENEFSEPLVAGSWWDVRHFFGEE